MSWEACFLRLAYVYVASGVAGPLQPGGASLLLPLENGGCWWAPGQHDELAQAAGGRLSAQRRAGC